MNKSHQPHAADAPSSTPAPAGPASVGREEDGFSLIEIANMLLRQRRLMLAVPLVTTALAIGMTAVITGDGYMASSRFMPDAAEASPATSLSGLAAQLGFVVGASGGSGGLAFYAELLKSREILRDAARTTYRFPTDAAASDTLSGTLIELYGIEGPTEDARLRAAVGRLNRDVVVTTQSPAGLVLIETTAPWPALAVQLNRRLLTLVNDFNLRKRQSQARAEREFIEARLHVAREELTAAEEELRTFMERNRRFTDSPELSFELGRLERQVNLRQQLYTSLAQAHDQARIEEVRNTPVVTVVEQPEGSARSVKTLLPLAVVVGLVLGGILGLGLAFLRDHIARHREAYPEEFLEFDELRRATIADLSPRHLREVIHGFRNGPARERARVASPDRSAEREHEPAGGA